MNRQIVEHLFEFWSEIGKSGRFLDQDSGFVFTKAENDSWPSKLYNIEVDKLDFKDLKQGISSGKFPDSIGVPEQKKTQEILTKNGFILTSAIKAMALSISNIEEMIVDEIGMVRVDSREKSEIFAKVASRSFGYEVLDTTILPLYKKPAFKLFLGMHGDSFASCGMVYLDKNGVSGIHMIGTLPEYRGLGLGKMMTQNLIHEALKNDSKDAYLVASKAGERIYTKMGFTTHGVLESYSLKKAGD